jgi:HSP20 family protein
MFNTMKIVKRDDNRRTYPSTYIPLRSVFDDFFTPTVMDDFFTSQPTFSSLSADVWEEDNDVFVKMALPGVEKDDIKITINEDNISIVGSSEKEEEQKDKKRKYYYKSMESSFEQSFNLPTKVNPDKVEAEFKDGVLTVRLPKADEVKPREVKIA